MATDYPEHEKLAEVAEHSQAIGEFLDWLQNEKGYTIAHYGDPNMNWLTPVHRSIKDLLAEYYDIDPEALEGEKRDMLEQLETKKRDERHDWRMT